LASLIISHLNNRLDAGLSTPKQIRCLERYGFRHVGEWTFEQASKLIAFLAAHSWRLPGTFDPEKYVPKGESV